MKTLVSILFIFSMINHYTIAGTNPELASELKRKVVVDLSEVEFDTHEPISVTVSFKIVDNMIKIQEINGPSKILEKVLVKELFDLHIESNHDEKKTYVFRFTFDLI